MDAATSQVARKFMGGVSRVQKAGAELGILNRKHAMLWLFQVFALSRLIRMPNMSDRQAFFESLTKRKQKKRKEKKSLRKPGPALCIKKRSTN
eukprot:1149000-Pelagomonas_calceolata.AAC.2